MVFCRSALRSQRSGNVELFSSPVVATWTGCPGKNIRCRSVYRLWSARCFNDTAVKAGSNSSPYRRLSRKLPNRILQDGLVRCCCWTRFGFGLSDDRSRLIHRVCQPIPHDRSFLSLTLFFSLLARYLFTSLYVDIDRCSIIVFEFQGCDVSRSYNIFSKLFRISTEKDSKFSTTFKSHTWRQIGIYEIPPRPIRNVISMPF